MDWCAQCVVVIPCLNEAAAIAELVREVRAVLPTILVVDDGSDDDTAALAQSAGATVLKLPHPQGKGNALQAGWAWARKRGFSWVLCMDGDGQHAPQDIRAFLTHAERSPVDLIIGNRMADPHSMPMIRRFVNFWMSARISALAGIDLPDTQCGFRLMRMAAWRQLELQTSHFEIESELLAAMLLHQFTVEFVPVRVIYKGEQSKIHPVRDAVRWFRWWWQMRAQFQHAKATLTVRV